MTKKPYCHRPLETKRDFLVAALRASNDNWVQICKAKKGLCLHFKENQGPGVFVFFWSLSPGNWRNVWLWALVSGSEPCMNHVWPFPGTRCTNFQIRTCTGGSLLIRKSNPWLNSFKLGKFQIKWAEQHKIYRSTCDFHRTSNSWEYGLSMFGLNGTHLYSWPCTFQISPTRNLTQFMQTKSLIFFKELHNSKEAAEEKGSHQAGTTAALI